MRRCPCTDSVAVAARRNAACTADGLRRTVPRAGAFRAVLGGPIGNAAFGAGTRKLEPSTSTCAGIPFPQERLTQGPDGTLLLEFKKASKDSSRAHLRPQSRVLAGAQTLQ